MNKRGLDDDTIKNTLETKKILWFLKELSEIEPDPSIANLYQDLYPYIRKQYFLGYLFRISAINIKKGQKSINFDPTAMESFINSIINKTHQIQSGEFENFMKKYVPLVINYIATETSIENLDDDLLSVEEFVNVNKNMIIDVNVTKIFENFQSVSNKKSAEIFNKKEGAINLELAFDEIFEELRNSVIARKINEEIKQKKINEESVPSVDSKNLNSREDDSTENDSKKRVHDDL